MRQLAAIILPLVPLLASAAEPPDLGTRKAGVDWPKLLGPAGDGVSPETGILTQWPATGLRILWQEKLGLGYAPPTIARGRIFTFDAHPDPIKKANMARLTVRESETGKELWRFEYATKYDDTFGYDNGPRCCPLIDGDRVYLHGAEGMLFCVSLTEKKVLWYVDTHADYGVHQNFFGVGSSPIIEGDLLIVPIGGSPKGSDPSDFMALNGNGTALVAFDKITGKEKYRVGDELSGYSTPVIATVNGKRLGFYFGRNGLMGFDPSTGKQTFHFIWRARTLECVNAANPVIVGDKVLISECYGVGSACLKVKPDNDGVDEVWTDDGKGRTSSLRCHWNTPIHVDGYVYGCSGRHTNEAELRCVELATGKVAWRQRGMSRGSLTQIDGHFLYLCEDGLLLLLKINPKKYEEVARWDLGESQTLAYPCWAAPVVSHGLMYLRGNGKLICVELIQEKR
jgi:outer membrane protein assembly factor BamB